MRLLQGDCLDVMRGLPDQSVDLVLADLPYGTTACRWDTVIPLDRLWLEYDRVCKPTSPVVLFGAQPFTSALVMSNIDNFKYDWAWRKTKGTGHLNAKRMPLRDKEDILVFYRRQCIYNPQMKEGSPYKSKAGDPTKRTSQAETYGDYTNFRYDNPGVRYPRQVLEFPSVERGGLHPTQKPVDLCRYLIRTYTNPGMVVLDNAMGSGTTGLAAIQEGRSFIGIELDEDYFNTAQARLEGTVAKS